MSARPSVPAASRGFGLVELLVAMALVTVVLGAMMFAFFRTSSQTFRLRDVTDRRQSARTAVQLIEREMRMSGSGWGRIPIYGNNSAGNPDTLLAVSPGFSGAAADDSVRLVGAWQTSSTIAQQMPSSSSTLKVQDVTGFNPGDLVLITNGLNANMMQVTNTNPSSGNLNHNPASPYNNPGGLNAATWPQSGYNVGSIVCKLTVSSYYMDRTSFRKPALMRHEYGVPPQVLAYNVDGFRVWYEMQDGTWTRNPRNMLAVNKVSPVVLTRVTNPNRPALVDSVWAVVQPRSF